MKPCPIADSDSEQGQFFSVANLAIEAALTRGDEIAAVKLGSADMVCLGPVAIESSTAGSSSPAAVCPWPFTKSTIYC